MRRQTAVITGPLATRPPATRAASAPRAKKPLRVPRFIGRLFAGESG